MSQLAISDLIEFIIEKEAFEGKCFLSLGNYNSKATVKKLNFDNNIKQKVEKSVYKMRKKTGKYPEWIKLDLVTHYSFEPFEQICADLINKRRNYVDFGICFDENWNLAFIAEEINSNAFVKPSKKNKGDLIISENNINHYLSIYKKTKRIKMNDFFNKKGIKFLTKGYFFDYENIYELEEKGSRKNLRKSITLTEEIDRMIETSTTYLTNEIEPNGKYKYGYFPHFDREIKFYNVLRHCSSTYSLIEGLGYLGRDISIARKPLEYIINNAILYVGDKAYVFDNNVNEVKLGQNAAFIFAACQYLKYFPEDKELLFVAQSVAKGVLSMINQNTMDTIHVLHYPDLSIKDSFRIIYYDGEAALALLRLYQIDANKKWLNIVKAMMDNFIDKEYWKYHDHWLSYCTNELVQISPEEKYFKFGMKNVNYYLDFIYDRETSFPTFLEMLMSTQHLIKKAYDMSFENLVQENIDIKKFEKTLHHRASYQRTGYFYPEVAMYFKNPKRTLGAFFIKHHGYRTRIDDIEHFLSGYVNYQLEFKK